jgi:hypothetical protein
MTEQQNAEFQQEGSNPFESESENENSEASQAEENKAEDPQSPEGEEGKNTQDDDKDIPFHQHPRWKQREKEWDERYNSQEARHQEDIKKLREEFADSRKENANQTQIPSWFGGDQAQWEAYRKDRDAEIKEAEERAFQRLEGQHKSEDKAVKEATDYMNAEIKVIQEDKELNPKGAKIDPNKLLKVVMDNDLIDSKGRWNYRAGWRILQAQPATNFGNQNRKDIAGATTSESKGEDKPASFKTSTDFKKNRPW